MLASSRVRPPNGIRRKGVRERARHAGADRTRCWTRCRPSRNPGRQIAFGCKFRPPSRSPSSRCHSSELALVSAYLRQNPNSATAHKILGMDQYTLGRSAEALTEMKRAIELAPNDADAFYYLGRLYFSADNAVAALAAFQRAIRLDSSSVRAHNHLCPTYEALERHGES